MRLINYYPAYKLPAFNTRCAWIIVVFIFATTHLFAQHAPPSPFSAFKFLSDIPADKRVDSATEIYKSKYRRLNEAVLMAVLDSVQQLAQKLDDEPLEASVYLMRADYYSVNKGYNHQSIAYHQKAIDYTAAHYMPVENAVCLHKKGLYYFTFNHNIEACRYFLQGMDKFRQIGFSRIPNISTYILEQAKFYYSLKDYATAEPLLKSALQYPINNIRTKINVVNTIGLIHREFGRFPQAMDYFNKALKIARANKDSAWIGIMTGNIGSVYFMQGQYVKAIPYLVADYKASLKYAQFSNAAQTLLRLSNISVNSNRVKDAAAQLDSVEILIHKSPGEDVLALWVDVYKQREKLCQLTGQYRDAVNYAVKYETLKDSLSKRNSIAAIERVKLTWEAEKYRGQIDHLHTQADVEAFKRNAMVCIFFLLLIIVLLLFNRYRLNARREQEMLLLRKKRVDEKLKNAAEALQEYTENIKQNNAQIEKYKAEIAAFKTRSTTDKAGAEHLEKLMQAHIMTDESWSEFKKLFTKVHAGFFTRLRNDYPYLTDTDMRLLSLVKLGLNNREMANMLGITIEGIKKSKQRLRKKMQLPFDTDIEQTVAQL
ncbi:tetratricopeptide repeat protein [Mucilaginibacter mali]|uniref:Tetratricopeptide repeat protein n=1 Tax=Mucilaginibacter mali TaxID=2740462 RepID=A0A7D4ULX1_9SPHI|nr:tetratricopeptide repeat protein [Mucilaginibacter mali]QKJ32322.1 tetratricopeptide repeat protein [Mucilaginibacter mali]